MQHNITEGMYVHVHVRICIAAPSYTRSVQKCRKILKVASTPPRLSSLVSSPRSAPTSARIISNQPVGALVGVVYETCHAAKSRLTDRHRPVHGDDASDGNFVNIYHSCDRTLSVRGWKPSAKQRKYIFQLEFTLRWIVVHFACMRSALKLSKRKRRERVCVLWYIKYGSVKHYVFESLVVQQVERETENIKLYDWFFMREFCSVKEIFIS